MPLRRTTTSSSASATANVTFPLPPELVPKIELTDADVAKYRQTAREVISTTLRMEIEYRYRDLAMLNPHDWKFVKSKERFRVYKRVTPSDDAVSMVLGVGFIEGTLENAFYGLHHKTTEEMRKTTTFVNKSILDTAVLANLETGTDDDPYRYLGLKWRVARTPGGNLIKNRDVCNLECMGMEKDGQGITYGYHLLKSVDIPGFPVYPESVVIRAQMMLCCIYRQVAPNLIAFYSKGVFNLCGELADFMAYNTSADMVLSISHTVDCAAAKRLTLMLMESDKANGVRVSKELSQSQLFGPRASADSVVSTSHDELASSSFGRSMGSSLGSSMVSSRSSATSTVSDAVTKSTPCALCHKKPSLLRLACKPCRICHEAACSKCYVKAKVFAQPRNFRIVCCKACVVKSRELPVDPRDPYPIINGSCFQHNKTRAPSSTLDTDY